jgi:hypothetical protein
MGGSQNVMVGRMGGRSIGGGGRRDMVDVVYPRTIFICNNK